MSDGGGTEENSGTMEVSTVQTVADTSVLQKHIRKLVPLLLEDGGEAPASLETAVEEKSAVDQMRKFLADPQIHTILVERSALKGNVTHDILAQNQSFLFFKGCVCSNWYSS